LKKTLLLFVIGIATLASIGLAQDEKDYQTWMKTVQATNGTLRKNIEAKMGDAAAADADKLSGVFKQVAAFWEMKGGADAVSAAQKAALTSDQISMAAKSGNWTEASAGLTTLGGTCGGCHMAHRERGPDGFKIK
jgi:hypothetical protein